MSATIDRSQIIDLEPREFSEDFETAASHAPILVSTPFTEPTSEQRMKAMEMSGSLDFWDRPEEDVYTFDDGDPA